MIIKKIISLLISLLMFFGFYIGNAEYNNPVTVEGAIFGGQAGDSMGVQLEFDSDWITDASNKIYNGKLAAFSALLCADSYFRSKDLSKGTQNRVIVGDNADSYTQTALLESLGYSDVRFIETFKAKQYASDNNDSATIVEGYKNVDGKYDSYIFVLRGCFSAGERLSAFDAGCDSDAYKALTGEHPEWTNKGCFKGLDVASSRAMEFIDEYIAEHDDESRENTVLLTGHSRGASIANIIGAELEKDNDIKSYTYTFNAMPVTTQANAGTYLTVFNIFDTNDYYTNPLPFGKERFVRYGRDMDRSIAQSDGIKSKIASVKGRDDYRCMNPEAKKEYDKVFGRLFPDRASLYEMKNLTFVFDTETDAQAKLGLYTTYIGSAGLGLSDFCSLSEVSENGGKYQFTMEYCTEAILYSLAQIQAYGASAYGAVAELFAQNTDASALAEIVFNSLDDINGGHLLVNGFVLSGVFGKIAF